MTNITEEMIKYAVSSVMLEGIRGFRHAHCFEFGADTPNLAIFAPNGFGKSVFPDGFEFVTSQNGTIDRLGTIENLSLNKAGLYALKNVFTDLDKKEAYVRIEVEKMDDTADENNKQTKSTKNEPKKTKFQFKRLVGKSAKRKPKEFSEFLSELNVTSLIRGDELKSFVADQSAAQRFKEACQFTGQEKVFTVLNKSRISLAETISDKERVNEEIAELNIELAVLSNQNVIEFDEGQVLSYLNSELIAPLSGNLSLSKLDLLDPTYLKLCSNFEKCKHTEKAPNDKSNYTETSLLRDVLSVVIKFYCLKQEFIKLSEKAAILELNKNAVKDKIEKNSTKLISEVQDTLDQIHEPMNEYYQYIQQDESQTIKTYIDLDEETGEERLNLSINFASNRKNAQPAGYLSNSQMHSFALAFRLALIKVLNPKVPILVLDDIVTSYDAQFRFRIASLLAGKFLEFQIILFTHDEQFYQMLIDKMDPKKWKYDRIVRFNREYGPIFNNYIPPVMEMNRLWKNDQSAAHIARKYQENYAKGMVKDLGIRMPILDSNTTRNYRRADLIQAIAEYLKEVGLVIPQFDGIQRDILQYFQTGKLENSLLHVNDETFGTISVGDEEERWKEFLILMELFTCSFCRHKRFATKVELIKNKKTKEIVKKKTMICRNKSCGKAFAFGEPKNPNELKISF